MYIYIYIYTLSFIYYFIFRFCHYLQISFSGNRNETVDESKSDAETATEDIVEESKESDESISTTKSSLKRLKGVRRKPKEDENGNLGSRVEDLLSSLKEA